MCTVARVDPAPGEHPNVGIVRASFLRTAAGDLPGAMVYWAPGAQYHAFDADAVESRDLHEVADVVRSGQELLAQHENEIIEIRAIGDELVTLHLRVRAVSRAGREMVAEYLIVLNVRDGKIHWACDFIDKSIQSFLDEAWS